jgi:hypothetical protein
VQTETELVSEMFCVFKEFDDDGPLPSKKRKDSYRKPTNASKWPLYCDA